MIAAIPIASELDDPGAAVARFRTLIAEHLGLQFENDKLAWLAELLGKRVRAVTGGDSRRYLTLLGAYASRDSTGAQQASRDEWDALAPDLTVAETYFFRHGEQFQALRDRLLPERLQVLSTAQPARPLRILSAGCATGEEAYSIAMTIASLRQSDDGGAWQSQDVRIDAIDVNPAVLAKARAGVYRGWSLRETPDAMRQRWFTQDGLDYVLDDGIRAMVRFIQFNLADEQAPFWAPDTYDIVFCRNVLMYFGTPRMQGVLNRMAHGMAAGAYLMLGHAESVRGLSTSFSLRHSHGTFYYQLTGQQDSAADVWTVTHPAPAASRGDWVQAIGASTERIRALAAPNPPFVRQRPAPEPSAMPDDVPRLFLREQFQEALALLERWLKGIDAATPAQQVQHAMLLMHVGRTGDAEALCRTQIAVHPFDADLHHALSLCQEAAGQPRASMDSDRAAGFLDPAFAMPHVHLGLLARRAGDADAARRACAMALRLLPRESAERLRLFAGGFSREVLGEACRRELDALGGDAT